MTDPQTWMVKFSDEVRGLIIFRDTPPGAGLPWCVVCGEPIRSTADLHHRRRRGPGDGRPSNGIAVHGRLEAEQCHHARVHEDRAAAQANGWIVTAHGNPAKAYHTPLLCARRGWIVLDDTGGWRPATTKDLHRH